MLPVRRPDHRRRRGAAGGDGRVHRRLRARGEGPRDPRPGEVFGERQSGLSDLKLGRIPRDEAIVIEARARRRGDPRRRSRPRRARAAPRRGRGPPRRRRRLPVQELMRRSKPGSPKAGQELAPAGCGSSRGRRAAAGSSRRPASASARRRTSSREAMFSALDARGRARRRGGARPLRGHRRARRSRRCRAAPHGRCWSSATGPRSRPSPATSKRLGIRDRAAGRRGRDVRPFLAGGPPPGRRRSTWCSSTRPTRRPTTRSPALLDALAGARVARAGRDRQRRAARAGIRSSPRPGSRAGWERTFGDTLVFFV